MKDLTSRPPPPRVRRRIRNAPNPTVDPVITMTKIGDLKPCQRNARKHSDRQISLVARSIETFGFINPIVIDETGTIVAGHGRYEAAVKLGRKDVPVIRLRHLSDVQVKAYRLLDNRLAELSSWDDDLLRLEVTEMVELEIAGDLDFDIDLLGFETAEIDVILEAPAKEATEDETFALPEKGQPVVTHLGDLWQLGRHRLLCADSQEAENMSRLIGEEPVSMVFTDPPYNVRVNGHVSGTGTHSEFAMASGEMDEAEFRAFLRMVFVRILQVLVPGGIAMICMDWRHVADLIQANRKATGFDLLNICIWNKTNGGMGSFYRSKHEMVCIFRKPGAPHINNIELGRHGRYRTNVWDYAGVNTFRQGRDADLASHPTVKPTALVADAIRDVTRHRDLILDLFGGSGSTLLAAEKTGRCARLTEIDPAYVDLTIRRWQALTGQQAVHIATGTTFNDREAALYMEQTDEQ